MTKKEYLHLQEVQEFSNWLLNIAKNKSGFSFRHNYEIESKGKNTKRKPWSCDSLFDAYCNYSWNFSYTDLSRMIKTTGGSFSESEKTLLTFEKKLKESIKNNDNSSCYKTCVMILDWGGVLGSDKSGNKKRLNELKPILCDYLTEIKTIFNSSDVTLTRQYRILINDKTIPITMNAGFTKIYSLLCEKFIIYDGRVGAALGLLVRRFYEQNHPGKLIPASLAFYYGKAKNPNVNRNPSKGNYIFKALSSSPAVHIRNNLKANWIIQNITHENCGNFNAQNNPSRCIEAALFMIGYKMN